MRISARIANAVVAGAAAMLAVTVLVLNLSSGERKIDHRIAHLYSVGDAQFVRSMGSLFGAPVVAGKGVVELLNGDQIFPSMLEAIRGARRAITSRPTSTGPEESAWPVHFGGPGDVRDGISRTKGGAMKKEQLNELLYQALETEMGGVQIYTTALKCVVNSDLKEEWEEYLGQTQNHVRVVRDLLGRLELDPEAQTPGRKVVKHIGESLVEAMEMALRDGNRQAAEIVAAECVVLAETKDHLNWELIGEAAKKLKGETAQALKKAHDEVEDEEDEHLYHTAGWCREMWIEALGMPAVLPPPEEEKEVKTAIGAARAKQARQEML